MNECFRRRFPPGSWEQSESVAISAAVEEKGGSLPGLTAGRGPLLGLWPRPLLLTQGADSKPSVYGSSECGGSLMWGPLYHTGRSRLDIRDALKRRSYTCLRCPAHSDQVQILRYSHFCLMLLYHTWGRFEELYFYPPSLLKLYNFNNYSRAWEIN